MRKLVGTLVVLTVVSGCATVRKYVPKVLGCKTAPAACCGDCDGNGVVIVTELTKQARIYQGLDVLNTCPAADCNGNGVVDVGDIQQANISAQTGCPK